MHNIGYPLGLVHEFDEPYFQLFCNLFLDLKEPFDSHIPQLLVNKHHVSIGIYVVLGYLKVNARHIFIRPSKHLLEFYE